MRQKKLFVIKKYVMATNLADAVRLDKRTKPDDVWIDDDWRKENMKEESEKKPFGFEKQ